MKTLKCLLAAPLMTGLALCFTACNEERPVAKIIKVDQKMPLIEWPDSVYVNSLDSILALEPVRKPKNENVTNLRLNPNKAPVFNLPSSVTGKPDKKTASKDVRKGNQEARGMGLPQGQSNDAFGKKGEAFSDKFMRAMSALQSDPNNSSLYKMVVANEEDLSKLLRRTYGAGSQSLPGFLVRSELQTVNPNVDLDHLRAGDRVKVPRL